MPFDHVDENGYKRGKTPRLGKWSQAPVLTLDDLKKSYQNGSNIGVRLGEPSLLFGHYLYIIDMDIRDASKAPEALAALRAIFPGFESFPMVISGSGGESRHIYFLCKQKFTKKNLAKSKTHQLVWDDTQQRNISRNDWEIDLMGTGSQAVVPPSLHPETHKPYVWLKPLQVDLLDFGIGPIVAPELVESWGARAVADAADEDDLETLWANSPMALSDVEIDNILAYIPNDSEEFDADGNLIRTGAHYDDYIEVGMALHHQFEGSEDGFEKWVAWAEQASKFDLKHARYRWDRSFGDARIPVRMATLIQKANNNKLTLDHDFDDDNAFDAALPVVAAPSSLAALLDMPPPPSTDLSVLLGCAVGPTVTPMVAPVAPENWTSLFHRNEDGEIKTSLPNVRLMMAYDPRTIGTVGFNEFRQELVLRKPPRVVSKKRSSAKGMLNMQGEMWAVPDKMNGKIWSDSNDTGVRAVFEAPTTQGGYGIKISDRDLRGAIDMVAQDNRFHPVRDLLGSLNWDQAKRMDTMFIDYLGSPDDAYHREAARLMLLGAVARIFEPGHKFDFVVIFEGAQGKGKSSFIRTLALHWYNELSGDPSDVQSMVELMLGSWILEMGEMSAMARAEVNEMKAFVTRQSDKVRLAYGRRAQEFPRQCIFIGSTNDKEYLRDVTGGRRWWPVTCHLEGMIDNPRFATQVLQIWAEAVAEYHKLRLAHPYGELPLFMHNKAAADQAAILQDSRRTETGEEILAGQIEKWLDTPDGDEDFDDLDADAPKVVRNETCIQQVWSEMMRKEGTVPHTEAMRIGRSLSMLDGWDRTDNRVWTHEVNKRYGKCRVYTRRVVC